MKKDSAVSSVVGEMLMLAVVVILAGIFAVGAMSFLPGERDDVIDITADFFSDPNAVIFTHRGGDVVSASDLKVTVYRGTAKIDAAYSISGTVFDLGNTIQLSKTLLQSGDEIRISTGKSIVYAGVMP
ncbi:MAG TPA: type IV pilin N-terminal domain-containing protein [Methanocorpusculum sp.]|nr:type IV pilin N-terminal domain-containing protein [Methanocorpusculum sp.]